MWFSQKFQKIIKPKNIQNSCPQAPMRSSSEGEKLSTERQTGNSQSADQITGKSDGYLENEIKRLGEERDTLTLLLVHKKDEYKTMISTPVPPKALAIPGNNVSKFMCDNCHHRGHRSHGNKGNKSCPFLPCAGYHFCGIMNKHKEYKQEVLEAEKEISTLEKEVKGIGDQIDSIKTFLMHNATNFIVAVKPRLKAAFPMKYCGKTGTQALQKDLRFIKLACGGKIPPDLDTISKEKFEKLMTDGKSKITVTCGNVEELEINADYVTAHTSRPIQNISVPGSDFFSGNSQVQTQFGNVWNSTPPVWPQVWSLGHGSASPVMQVPVHNNQRYPAAQQPSVLYNYVPVHGPPSCTITRPPDDNEDIIMPPLPEEVPPCQPPMPEDI